jgi:hypothetical protein
LGFVEIRHGMARSPVLSSFILVMNRLKPFDPEIVRWSGRGERRDVLHFISDIFSGLYIFQQSRTGPLVRGAIATLIPPIPPVDMRRARQVALNVGDRLIVTSTCAHRKKPAQGGLFSQTQRKLRVRRLERLAEPLHVNTSHNSMIFIVSSKNTKVGRCIASR